MSESLPIQNEEITILMVDDTPQNLRVLGEILEEYNYDLCIAINGREAVETAKEVLPDLILMDIQMPEMNGFEACYEIRNTPETAHIPVIFLSAKSEASDIVKGFDVGGMDYVTKPFNPAELMARVKTHISLNKAYRELEQQHTSLLLANKKMEDLYQHKDFFLETLESLEEEILPYILERLEKALKWPGPEAQTSILESLRQVRKLDQKLKPIQFMYQSGKAVQNKRVLLAEANRKQQIIAKMALGGSGLELDLASDKEKGRQMLEANHYDVLCVNSEFVDLVEPAHAKNPEILSVFLTSKDAPAYIQVLRKYDKISNIVSRNEEDRIFTLKNLLTTISKLVSGDIFGLEKYLNWGVEVKEHTLQNSKQRSGLVDQLRNDFRDLGVRSSVVSRCEMIAEELMMNAVYDAPTDASGKPKYNHLPRTQEINLEPSEYSTLRYACDGMLVGVSVEDEFGAFDRKTILDYLQASFEGRSNELQASMKKGGAGRGLFQIIQTADLVVFNVRPRFKTEVMAFLNIQPDANKNKNATSFHYFLA
jgi:DNA-binding response OmpR family regulator